MTAPNHLTDHGWRLEVWSRASELLAVAEVRTAGLWWMQTRGHDAFYVGGREQAETCMRELVSP
jgi:hypothetical protein